MTEVMTEIRARLAPGRNLGPDDFAEFAEQLPDVGWGEDGRLVVRFAEDLPAEAQAAVERRIVSETAREEQLRAEAEAYLADAAPDLTEITAQVKRLTEIVLGKSEA